MSPSDYSSGEKPSLAFPPVVVAIAGCSGSGKTTLAEKLAYALGGIHFPLDNYYRDLSHLPPGERALKNFDDPAMIESTLLTAHVAALSRGETIERPMYDFATHTRLADRTETVHPHPFVLIEGIFALCYADLLPLYQLRVFIETPEDICFERRLGRDVSKRGRSPISVCRQYDATVRPAAIEWVLPSAAKADLVVNGTDELDAEIELVVHELRLRGFAPLK